MTKHCCEMMTENVTRTCPQHPDRRNCPDTVIDYSAKINAYGLPIHDGENGRAESWISIRYCPWCGTKLPSTDE